MEQTGHHSQIAVLDAGILPFRGSLSSPGLPDAQASTQEGEGKSLCPETATNMLCDLSKILSPRWQCLSFPVCTRKAFVVFKLSCGPLNSSASWWAIDIIFKTNDLENFRVRRMKEVDIVSYNVCVGGCVCMRMGRATM